MVGRNSEKSKFNSRDIKEEVGIMLTKEFKEAVAQGNLLLVHIMLKDSLLIDTSFKQFDEMVEFAESKLDGIWVDNVDDKESFYQSADNLDNILVGLVNNFSKKRVRYLKTIIRDRYPQKPIRYKHEDNPIKITYEAKKCNQKNKSRSNKNNLRLIKKLKDKVIK